MPGGVAVRIEDRTFEWSMNMVGWLLYNYPLIADMYQRMEPSITTKYVDIPLTLSTSRGNCKVVKVAIERAAVSSVLDAVSRAIATMHPEQRRIQRLKYREGLTNKEIQRKLNVSRSTIDRRIQEIKAIVARELALVPDDMIEEFWKKIDQWNERE